ncbi:MAG: ABC transporter ATP-binding protein [Lachnospiraceae bacterium]|jgi:putative ABC transport system ATP-binding protein|nr:ABC transporter ATP-binding protein [Lachnospiraceae bacterium]MCI9014267.1 ABC transporter ATP-binding protein [Lachnospiraceae bacterium]MCI9253465.1 ABC transporter ATP-binding protein [Lachnospiraceae bacterium]
MEILNSITIRHVKKYYGSGSSQVKALDGVDLSVAQGEFVAIVGASGSGKTTLLNMMGGLDAPTEGEVIVDGVNLGGLREEQRAVFRRKKVGFIFQNYNLVPTLTVEENILFPLDLDGSAPDFKFLEEMTELLGLRDKLQVYPGALSGGQQQRAAIARALMAKPAIILADEPTGNLDSQNGQNVAGLLKMTAQLTHRTLVLVTHNLELAQLADRVVQMKDGRIVSQ